jgi:hypothetical protein
MYLQPVGRNNIAPNVINRRSRRNTLRYYALRLLIMYLQTNE